MLVDATIEPEFSTTYDCAAELPFPQDHVKWNMSQELQEGVKNASSQVLKSPLLLDSQSSCNYTCNPRMVTNIQKAGKVLVLNTNGGTMQTDLIADIIGGLGQTWHDPKGIANTLSLSVMKRTHHI